MFLYTLASRRGARACYTFLKYIARARGAQILGSSPGYAAARPSHRSTTRLSQAVSGENAL
jgi:hypothetical protein